MNTILETLVPARRRARRELDAQIARIEWFLAESRRDVESENALFERDLRLAQGGCYPDHDFCSC